MWSGEHDVHGWRRGDGTQSESLGNVKRKHENHEVEGEYPSETWHTTINSYNPTICKHAVVKALTYI